MGSGTDDFTYVKTMTVALRPSFRPSGLALTFFDFAVSRAGFNCWWPMQEYYKAAQFIAAGSAAKWVHKNWSSWCSLQDRYNMGPGTLWKSIPRYGDTSSSDIVDPSCQPSRRVLNISSVNTGFFTLLQARFALATTKSKGRMVDQQDKRFAKEFFLEFLDLACAHLINATDHTCVPIWHEVTSVEPEIYHGLGAPMELSYDKSNDTLAFGQFVTELRRRHARAALALCEQLEELMIPETESVALIDIFENLVNSKIGHLYLWQLAAWIGIMFEKQIHVHNWFLPGSEVQQPPCVLKRSLPSVALGVYKENRLMMPA